MPMLPDSCDQLWTAHDPEIAIVFDRDGTLIENVPYNGDAGRVVPRATVKEALLLLRERTINTAVVSNQSGVGRGLLTVAAVDQVNRRMVELIGDVGPFFICPHSPADGCGCRKPSPALVLQAARHLNVDASRVAVIGDRLRDIDAARAAGAIGVLVPSLDTPMAEVEACESVFPTFYGAVLGAISKLSAETDGRVRVASGKDVA